jgi:hypothetical protein
MGRDKAWYSGGRRRSPEGGTAVLGDGVCGDGCISIAKTEIMKLIKTACITAINAELIKKYDKCILNASTAFYLRVRGY